MMIAFIRMFMNRIYFSSRQFIMHVVTCIGKQGIFLHNLPFVNTSLIINFNEQIEFF